MDSQFFRKYADIVEAAEKAPQQLDEGMMDTIKKAAMMAMPKFSSAEIEAMKSAAQKVLGKSEVTAADFTLNNIKAISQTLGVKGDTKPSAQQVAESMDEGVVDVLKGAGQKVGNMASAAGKKVGDFFGQTKVDPKSGKGSLGSVDAWHPEATLGDKLTSVAGTLGGAAAMIAGFFGGPAWLILPGILALMFLSQIGGSKD